MPAPAAGQADKRRFTRQRPSGIVSKGAKVYADQKGAALIDCNLLDISTGGACLETVGDAAVPAKLMWSMAACRSAAS